MKEELLPKVPNNKNLPDEFTTKWECPSNIALIKYWGKKANQIPCNPSLSFTLSEAKTITSMTAVLHQKEHVELAFYLENQRNEKFEQRIKIYLETLEPLLGFISKYRFTFHSSNTFPHSSGIASSASGFGALSLCITEMFEHILEEEFQEERFKKRASYLARLGSGSACRSLYGGLAVWGKSTKFPNSSDDFAVPYPQKSQSVFSNFCDFILLVDKGVKKVSSSVGHALMNNHPFAEQRFLQADENLSRIADAIENDNVEDFGALVELEALTLHAMMLTSSPSFMLFRPNTISILEKIREEREQNGTQLYFTLDAGANVHLLCPIAEEKNVENFVKQKLLPFCENENYLCDKVGTGPKRLETVK